MNAYADYAFYCEVFHGRHDNTEKNEVDRNLRKASAFLRAFIFDEKSAQENEDVKFACCEIADLYFDENERNGIKSESNDGYSVTYNDSEMTSKANEIALTYLAHTGLLYRGERCE